MTRARMHLRARGYVTPRGLCGANWLARVTRQRRRVTCKRCLGRMGEAS